MSVLEPMLVRVYEILRPQIAVLMKT